MYIYPAPKRPSWTVCLVNTISSTWESLLCRCEFFQSFSEASLKSNFYSCLKEILQASDYLLCTLVFYFASELIHLISLGSLQTS